MNLSYEQKKANFLPTSTTEWGPYIQTEAEERLPELKGYINEYRTIISPNEDGDGVSILILQGSKAFIPVVIKKWEVKPIDVIIYKKDRDIRYCYLSKRNVLKLLTTSSLGKASDPLLDRRAVSDVGINLMSPAGGSYTNNNPLAGMSYRTKSGSMYARKLLKSASFINSSDFVKSRVLKEVEVKTASYCVLHKNMDNDYILYAPNLYEQGFKLSREKVAGLFDTLGDTSKISKLAEFNADPTHTILFGKAAGISNNVLMKYQPQIPDKEDFEASKPIPSGEGVYNYQGLATYINPKVVYLDNSESTYALGVQPGGFTLSKDFSGFEKKNTPESSDFSREDLVTTPDNVEVGQILCIYHQHQKWVTIPFKVLLVDKSLNHLTIHVKPLVGISNPCSITFYNKDNVIKVNDNTFLYPILFTKLWQLPDYKRELSIDDPNHSNDSELRYKVMIKRLGGNLYQIQENNALTTDLNAGETMFKLISRYGLSENQAKTMMQKVYRDKYVLFNVRNILTELPVIAPVNIDETVSMQEKEAIDNLFKIASGLYKNQYIDENVLSKAAAMDNKFYSIIDSFTKTAVNETDPSQAKGSQVAEERAQENANNLGAINQKNNQSAIMGMMSTPNLDRNTSEVIDLITYLATSESYNDDTAQLAIDLDKAFDDAENYLSKILLLTLFGQVPGHEYSDVKLLLSDIDNYRSTLSGSIVMIKGLK